MIGLYLVWEGEPILHEGCPHTDWHTIPVGQETYRWCVNCSRTECSVPGVDSCSYVKEPPWKSPPRTEARVLEAIFRGVFYCHTLTDGRCAHCDRPFCSEHVGEHMQEEHAALGVPHG